MRSQELTFLHGISKLGQRIVAAQLGVPGGAKSKYDACWRSWTCIFRIPSDPGKAVVFAAALRIISTVMLPCTVAFTLDIPVPHTQRVQSLRLYPEGAGFKMLLVVGRQARISAWPDASLSGSPKGQQCGSFLISSIQGLSAQTGKLCVCGICSVIRNSPGVLTLHLRWCASHASRNRNVMSKR